MWKLKISLKLLFAILVLIDTLCIAASDESCNESSGGQTPGDGGLTLLQVKTPSREKKNASELEWHPDIHAFIDLLESEQELGSEPTMDHIVDMLKASSANNSVLFVVMSDSWDYDNRLKWIRETWGQDIPSTSLLAIGDAAKSDDSDLEMHVESTHCPAHTHDGACCKHGEAVIHAYRHLKRQPKLSWAYIVDNDAYVRPAALQKKLRMQDALGDRGKGSIATICACGNEKCPHGFCGGAGAAFSRKALDTLVDNNPAKFFKQHMKGCKRCGMYGDVTLGNAAVDHGITPIPIEGLHGWFMKKAVFDGTLTSNDEPLMYHYMKQESQFHFLHKLFAKSDVDAPSQNMLETTTSNSTCANYRGNVVCSSDSDSWPWDGNP